VFYRYLTQIGIIPLTGTSSVEHMRDDQAIFEFELTTDECAAVDMLLY
jgi:diketogulonate reductase-like aldo/keto reductase